MSILAFVILPLLGAPELLLTWQVLYIIGFVIVLNFTQPALEKNEASSNKSSDGGSVFVVVICSALSLIIPLVHWAYFNYVQNIWLMGVGVIINMFGLYFRYHSIRVLGNFFKATVVLQNKHELITSGPYKILRHPSYTGALLSFTSISLILSSLPGFAASVVLMITAYIYRTHQEEKALKTYFGEKYVEYSKRTNKLIPFIW